MSKTTVLWTVVMPNHLTAEWVCLRRAVEETGKIVNLTKQQSA